MQCRAGMITAALLLAPAAHAETPSLLSDLVAGTPGARIASSSDNDVFVELDDAANQPLGDVILSRYPTPSGGPSRFQTCSWYVTIESHRPSEDTTRRLVSLAHQIQDRDHCASGAARMPPAPPENPYALWVVATVTAVLAGVVLRWRRVRVMRDFKLQHLLPAAIQLTIYVYWSVYWPRVVWHVPSIITQILFAYGLDALVSGLRSREWRVGIGPFPIVLSANLFIWYGPPGSVLVVLVAILSRHFIRRGGRHVMNPSAAGLAVALLASYALPFIVPIGLFAGLSTPPNLGELIVLLALIPQFRFPIVLASVGATLAIMVGAVSNIGVPGVGFPGTLLMLALFLTDPSTLPKKPLGQLAFGVFVGAGVSVTRIIGDHLGSPDDRLTKVLPVVVGNVLVPWFDRLGSSAENWRLPLLQPKWNLLHVIVWLLLAAQSLDRMKAGMFELTAPVHWTYGTPHVVHGRDDVPTCENNPVFCRPFSFAGEVALWVRR